MTSLAKENVLEAATQAACVTKAIEKELHGHSLTPEETKSFVTIALAASGSERFIDLQQQTTIPLNDMSGIVLDQKQLNQPMTIVLVGPQEVVSNLKGIRTAKGTAAQTYVEVPLPDGQKETIQLWTDSIASVSTTNPLGGLSLGWTRHTAIALDGTMTSIIPLTVVGEGPAFSIAFIHCEPDNARGIAALDVYLAPETPSFA